MGVKQPRLMSETAYASSRFAPYDPPSTTRYSNPMNYVDEDGELSVLSYVAYRNKECLDAWRRRRIENELAAGGSMPAMRREWPPAERPDHPLSEHTRHREIWRGLAPRQAHFRCR